jgi:phospholipase C
MAGKGLAPPTVSPAQFIQAHKSAKIQHIVIVIQENRSLNDLFYGFPGARTVGYGYDTANKKIPLKPVGLEAKWDLAHNSKGFLLACNGVGSVPGTDCRMNGFDREQVNCGPGHPCPKITHPQYAYVPQTETKPYFEMARQYVLADEMFASDFDASSFVSHQYIIAGQASSAVNYPDTNWGCPGGKSDKVYTVTQSRGFGKQITACFQNTTLADELDTAGISWAYYAITINPGKVPGTWSAYQAIKHIYSGPDWAKDIISPPSQFLTDVSSGKLRSVTWVTPTLANSDHSGYGSKTGPSWVASLVNAVGKSKYWKSTAILIFWDDYGGWFDPEAPNYLDYDGLGLRLPLLVISPYALKGRVSHTHYEHGSLLRFVEDTFGLGRLSASDKRANSLNDCFDFSQAPRKFVPIPAEYDQSYFLSQPLDFRPPDNE